MTWLIGFCISALGSALYAGMNADRLFYRDPMHAYEKNKGRILEGDKVGVYIGCALVGSVAWPLVLIAAVVAGPLYGVFKLGQKIAKRQK